MDIGRRVTINIFAENPVLADIPELGFLGTLAYSPSLRYTVAYSDSYRAEDGSLHSGGYRDSGAGTVILLADSCFVWERRMSRPTVATVSGDGVVFVGDIGFGTELKTRFLLVDRNGTTRLEDRIHAFVFSCGMTRDGALAVANSAGSDVDADSCKLFAYSVPEARRLFAVDFPIADINSVARSSAGLTVEADSLVYRYSFEGELLNRLEINRQNFDRQMESGRYDSAYYWLERCSKKSQDETETRFLQESYRRLCDSLANPECRAKAFRRLGEFALTRGNRADAVAHFRAALQLSPKIGLKRRLAELEKATGA